jgi:hypothetical protein
MEPPVTPTPAPEEPKKSNTTLIIAVVAVVLLCCCCITIAVLYQYGDQIFGPFLQ